MLRMRGRGAKVRGAKSQQKHFLKMSAKEKGIELEAGNRRETIS